MWELKYKLLLLASEVIIYNNLFFQVIKKPITDPISLPNALLYSSMSGLKLVDQHHCLDQIRV